MNKRVLKIIRDGGPFRDYLDMIIADKLEQDDYLKAVNYNSDGACAWKLTRKGREFLENATD